ncbi:haloacid dehalogenase type II [Aneurinibacillus sp. BA2021]|nr:haloacid dehalogenase type II [Aneurinibacillus sp. BA2021]
MKSIKAIVFDAYGTLFDVHSVIQACDECFPGQGASLSHLWRTKQLEYTWLRSLMGRYANFRQVTEEALVFACKQLDLPLDAAYKKRLMEEYDMLQPYAEVLHVLPKITRWKRAIFSNGSPDFLLPLVKNTGVEEHMDAVISVDDVKLYKPHPASYAKVTEVLEVKREEVLFLSSNAWDAAGAKSFGFHVAWLCRMGQPFDELQQTPDFVLQTLDDLLPILQMEC